MGTDSNGNPEERADRGWSADAYDDHSFVYEYGEGVVDLLDPEEGDRILDIGCGIGHLTERIAGRSPSVVERASAIAALADCVVGAIRYGQAETINSTSDEKLQAVSDDSSERVTHRGSGGRCRLRIVRFGL